MKLEGIQSIYTEQGLPLQHLCQVIVQPLRQPSPMPSLSPIQLGPCVSEADFYFLMCLFS